MHIYVLRFTVVEFFSNLSAIYTKSCAQTFPPIFGLFAIFDRNFAKLAVPPSNKKLPSVYERAISAEKTM